MNLLTVLPYCAHDADAAIRLLDWITELGRCEGYTVLLVADNRTPVEVRSAVFHAARKAYSTVYKKLATVDAIYPQAANEMFATASRIVYDEFKLPFLWLEPDCVPLKAGWLTDLATEYYWSPKPFVGPLVHTEPPQDPFTHLNGVSMYPQDSFMRLVGVDAFAGPAAWDMASSEYSVSRSHETDLISQFWGTRELVPTFVDRKRKEGDEPNVVNTKIINENSVLHHRCKDGSLIDVCRKRLAKGLPTIEPGNVGYKVAPRVAVPAPFVGVVDEINQPNVQPNLQPTA